MNIADDAATPSKCPQFVSHRAGNQPTETLKFARYPVVCRSFIVVRLPQLLASSGEAAVACDFVSGWRALTLTLEMKLVERAKAVINTRAQISINISSMCI
jgi:hypothetical protein